MTSGISIKSCLEQAVTQLAATESPHLDAEILLAHVLQQDRTWLHTWPEHILNHAQLDKFHELIARRVYGEPIAHLTGQREFWDMKLKVTPDTLIPRPETERLVELALEQIPQDAAWQIADLGTGSGAIALAIARERPRCHVLATDISARALAVARDNAQRLGVDNIRMQNSHWFESLGGQHFDLIVSNPPYIHPRDEHLAQGDVRFEPVSALASAPDGLGDLRHIIQQARDHLNTGSWLLVEHGFDQGPAARQLFLDAGYAEAQVHQDLSGQERVTAGKWLNLLQ